MTFTRVVAFPKGVSRTVLRRAGSNVRNRSWRQVGRRGYASDHGHGQQQSSEIPWIVGSAAVFFPSAAWLLGQGPKKSDHGHDEHEEEEEKSEDEPQEEGSKEDEPKEDEPKEDEPKEESEDEPKEESKDDGEDEAKSEDKGQEESKSEGDDDKSEDSSKSEGSSDKQTDEDGYERPGPNAPKQINWDSSKSKGPGEGQKGERKPSEKKGEKDSQGGFSGAQHPYLDDAEKSKKGAGVTETAKIHGTVDSRQGARGVGESGSRSD